VALHNYVMFYLIVIFLFVITMLVMIYLEFYLCFRTPTKLADLEMRADLLLESKFTHWPALEMLWTIFPGLVLLAIAFPSFSLLYAMDEHFKIPQAYLKVVGHQWYWSYQWMVSPNKTPGAEFDSYLSHDLQAYEILPLRGSLIHLEHLSSSRFGRPRGISRDFFSLYSSKTKILVHNLVNDALNQKYSLDKLQKASRFFGPMCRQFFGSLSPGMVEQWAVFNNLSVNFARSRFLRLRRDWLVTTENQYPTLYKPKKYEIDVRYPRLLTTDKVLNFPLNKKVSILVTSDDVLHAWAVPAFGVKIDCVPGRLSQVNIKVWRRGFFYGQCSELCGVGHAFMPIEVLVYPMKKFIPLDTDFIA